MGANMNDAEFQKDFNGVNGPSYRGAPYPPFDKYASDGKVPIPELMRYFNISFPCSFCGQHDFTLQSYEARTCHIIEGEGDLNVFTRGYIACNDCFKKLWHQNY